MLQVQIEEGGAGRVRCDGAVARIGGGGGEGEQHRELVWGGGRVLRGGGAADES